MTCPECLAAQSDAHHGIYMSACRGCEIRGISDAPRHLQEAYYEMLPAADREAARVAAGVEFRRRAATKT